MSYLKKGEKTGSFGETFYFFIYLEVGGMLSNDR